MLNEARDKSEKIIDKLHEPFRGKEKKVRTYRQRARREYLRVAKRRRAGKKVVRKGIKKQLQYLARNLRYIEELEKREGSGKPGKKEYRDLLVIKELYKQQKYMYENRVHRVSGRIVSISQPHVRPIVRGKVKAPVEFGEKIARQDEIDRIAVEGKFGNGKRKYGLGKIMSKRADTSESSIGMIILVMNM